MIESTALFFSLLFILQVLRWDHNSNISSLFFIVIGIIAALVKITTYLPFFLVSIFYLTIIRRYSLLCRRLIGIYSPIIISIIGWYIYCRYSVKADFIYSESNQEGYDWISNIHKNIFNPRFHGTLFWEIAFLVLPVSFYLIFGFVHSENKFNKFLLISFFSTTFVFSNLYLVHDYYIYGSGLLILFYLSEKISMFLSDKSNIFKYLSIITLILIGCLNYINNGYFNFQKKNIKVHKELVDYTKEIAGNGLIIGTYLDTTIPYLLQKKCVTLGNYKGHNDYLKTTLTKIKDHCAKHDHLIKFCIMKNDQNFTHVKHLSDNLFGTSQYVVFDQYTVLH